MTDYLTLAQAKNSRLRRISGSCPDSQDFLELLNDGIRMLMKRGNFWGTVKRMSGCVYSDCIVWPRQVQTVLAINKNGNSVPPRNQWYGFSAVLPEDVTNHGIWGDRCWGDIAARDGDTTSVFNQIPCLNDRYVRFYCMQPTDEGKTITLFGVDSNGQTIRSQRTDGSFQDGVVLTLAIPYVQTTFLVRRVDRILKDTTDGPVHGYQFDGATLYDLAHYDPAETSPAYRTSKIMGGCNATANGNGCCHSQISALVKLAYVPVQYDDDVILIDDLDALAMVMQAINQSDNYDADQFEKMILLAVRELNATLRNVLPIDTTKVSFKPQGTADLRRQSIGRLV